jgi:hypothetical protein
MEIGTPLLDVEPSTELTCQINRLREHRAKLVEQHAHELCLLDKEIAPLVEQRQNALAQSHAEQLRIRVRQSVEQLKSEGMQCNCDLDRWEPELISGHSWVCNIHKAAIRRTSERQ